MNYFHNFKLLKQTLHNKQKMPNFTPFKTTNRKIIQSHRKKKTTKNSSRAFYHSTSTKSETRHPLSHNAPKKSKDHTKKRSGIHHSLIFFISSIQKLHQQILLRQSPKDHPLAHQHPQTSLELGFQLQQQTQRHLLQSHQAW